MNCASYPHYYGDEGLTFQPRFWRVFMRGSCLSCLFLLASSGNLL